MADGGEGTAEAICEARGGSWLKCKAHDPLGREIEARYAWIEDGQLAVMEMNEAAGMRRLSESERDPVRATTFGVGEMILDAAARGANEIIIGLGGSATNDGGSGMARALRFRFDYEHPPSAGFGAESEQTKKVDHVMTCEGSLDRQTVVGKTTAGVARLARNLCKKFLAIAGSYDGN